MPISMTFSNESADGILADLQRIFPALVTGAGLPPMQEQPSRDPLPPENVKERKTRTKKTEDAKAPEGEPAAATTEELSASAKGISPKSADAPEVVTEIDQNDMQAKLGKSSGAAAAGDAASVSDAIPDIEDLRARLKTLGATEGFGHDKVFEVLGKYGAKNASTVPEEKRAACIAEIDELLKGGK